MTKYDEISSVFHLPCELVCKSGIQIPESDRTMFDNPTDRPTIRDAVASPSAHSFPRAESSVDFR